MHTHINAYLFICVIVLARASLLVGVNLQYFQSSVFWTNADSGWILMRGPSTPLSHDCWDWVALQHGTASQAEKEQHCACVQMQPPPPSLQQEKRAMLLMKTCTLIWGSTYWPFYTHFIHKLILTTFFLQIMQLYFLWCSHDLDESNKAAFNFLY